MAWSSDISRRTVLKRAQRITATVPLLSILGCDGSSDNAAWLTLSGSTMGTRYRIKVMDPSGSLERHALESDIDQILEAVNDRMSTYRSDSELSRFNNASSTAWFKVSPGTARVVEEGLQVSRLSEGAFDATVGPLVDLWGFGPGTPTPSPPPTEHIKSQLGMIGHAKLDARNSPAAIRKALPNIRVDLSGIAKGYAVDRVADHLERVSADKYLVEIGGEMRVRGNSPYAEAWRIGVEKPVPGRRAIQRVVRLDAAAIATSGDYRIFFESGGNRYTHLIDPRTGLPVTHNLASVTVIAPSAMAADAWSTALMVIGPEEGFALAERLDLAAFFISKTEDGFRETYTPAFVQKLGS
jgi:thiamine biosynthesis lipoprotein